MRADYEWSEQVGLNKLLNLLGITDNIVQFLHYIDFLDLVNKELENKICIVYSTLHICDWL